MTGTIKPDKPRTGRTLLMIVISIAIVLVAAASAVALIGILDASDSGNENTGKDHTVSDGEKSLGLPFNIHDGDFIEYSVTSNKNTINGVVKMMFFNVSQNSYEVRMEQNIDGHSSALMWKADDVQIFGMIPHDGIFENLGEMIGEEQVDTVFGLRNVIHYRTVVDGATVDYYVGKDAPILYRTNSAYNDYTMDFELIDTNI